MLERVAGSSPKSHVLPVHKELDSLWPCNIHIGGEMFTGRQRLHTSKAMAEKTGNRQRSAGLTIDREAEFSPEFYELTFFNRSPNNQRVQLHDLVERYVQQQLLVRIALKL